MICIVLTYFESAKGLNTVCFVLVTAPHWVTLFYTANFIYLSELVLIKNLGSDDIINYNLYSSLLTGSA